MKEIQFDHTCNDIHEAMGICRERATEIEGGMLYQMIFQHIMREKLFDEDADDDEIPANFRTKTAILDKCLDYATDEQEQIFIAFQFSMAHLKLNNPFAEKHIKDISKVMMKLDLDEESFIKWFAKKKTEAEAENDED